MTDQKDGTRFTTAPVDTTPIKHVPTIQEQGPRRLVDPRLEEISPRKPRSGFVR